MDPLFVFGIVAIVACGVFIIYRSTRDKDISIKPRTGGGGGGGRGK